VSWGLLAAPRIISKPPKPMEVSMTPRERALKAENDGLRLKIQELQRRNEEEKAKWESKNVKKTGKGDDFVVSRKPVDSPIINP